MGAQGLEGWAGVPRAPELFLVLPSMPLRGAVCLPGPGTHMPLGPKPASQAMPSRLAPLMHQAWPKLPSSMRPDSFGLL